MSIEIGSKWVKDGEVVEVIALPYYLSMNMVVFVNICNKARQVHEKNYFLEQYIPCEILHEYKYIYRNYIDCHFYETDMFYKDDNEFLALEVNDSNFKTFQRLDFTKRERKQ